MKVSVIKIALCLLLSISESNGFFVVKNNPRRASSTHASVSSTNTQRFTRLFSKQQNDNTDSWDDYNPIREEQSKMPDYIASYINKSNTNKDEDNDTTTTFYTHMIGVPMDDCHELLLELESVQRAILYHCPLLVHACIVPAVTRMPLLYVSAPSHKSVATVTRTLHDICERVVQQLLYVKQTPTPTNPENEDEIMGSINSEGYKPLVMSFQNLEIDGQGNQVLSTVGIRDDGSARLTHLVDTLRTEIESLGWKVSFPPDEHSPEQFRPRVPFMRLPENFVELLDPLEDGQEDWMRTSDQGGNGISPIFWCQWWEDVMARHVRLREISVYPRQPTVPEGLGEQAFYIPHETTTLPTGNDVLMKAEARHRAYNDERMAEAEGRTLEENKKEENTLRDPQVQKQREHLETLYAAADSTLIDDDVKTLIDDDVKKEIEEPIEAIDVTSVKATLDVPSADSRKHEKSKEERDEIDDWTKERIRKAVETRAFVQAQKVEQKDKPNIEDNEVFQKYKNNTLVDKARSDAAKTSRKELPDFPSREHFVGIWRVVTSPTGFPEEAGDNTKSDNIILRVDGTIAGGPTLDQETNQKAAGGTWKMIDTTDEDATKLRIRLVIPPKKERILVMEGEVTRFMSSTERMPLSKSTFGIPELEAAAQKLDDNLEDLMHCGGNVWIEDAVTGKNRDDIGSFSLMKLQSPMEPGKYTITIPRPVRNQD